MSRIDYCPIVGERCNKGESAIRVRPDTFFLAEPFRPKKDRERRKRAVKNVLRQALGDGFSEGSLRVGDKDPKELAIFCDVCCFLQSSAYGIADISGLNPNVLLELGMMFSLGRPVFVLVKKTEEEDLKEKLPSDIVWKRVVSYEEFIDIEEELSRQIRNRPRVEPELSLGEEARKVFAEVDPAFAEAMDAKLEETRAEQGEGLKKLEKLLKEVGLGESVPPEKEVEITPSLQRRIEEIDQKVERIEELVGFPDDYESAFLMGSWHFLRKEYEEAITYYDRALDVRQDLEAPWNNKGVALNELGRHEEAIPCFDRAIEIKQDYEAAWNNKGNALIGLGRYEEAIVCYDRAIEIEPDYVEAWSNKGVALDNLGAYEEAIAYFDRAIEIESDYVEAWSNKGVALGHLRRYEEAIACYDRAIQIKPDYGNAWSNKGGVFAKLGEWEDARSCYEQALKTRPADIEFLENLSESLIALGDLSEGLGVAERAFGLAEKARDKAICWFLRISAYLFEGKRERAREEMEGLTNYLAEVGEGLEVVRWDFDLLPVIEDRLGAEDRTKLVALMSLLKGEIGLDEFEGRIGIS